MMPSETQEAFMGGIGSGAVLDGIRARAPQVHMVEVAASNHHIPLDNPRGFVDALKAFLRT